MLLRGLILVLALLASAAPLQAQDLLPVPALSGRVIDQTGTLSAEQVAALSARLAAFEAEAGSQIVVLMVSSTQPEDIAAYAQRVGDSWKIGRRDVGDGLLIVVA
ncbi:MAG: TPM domain-containing protein, partial [Rubrivivax sp.]|nr:TPM domain-containing protein [Rubrivivax sp.]